MKDIVVDIESDGPCPGLYSMISLGAVVLDDNLDKTFYTTFRPISDQWIPQALAVSGFTREQTEAFPLAVDGIDAFATWLKDVSGGDRLRFFSDNAGFDWQFVNYYFWNCRDENPFGHSPASITWLYKGFTRTSRASFRHLRKRKHTHNALDDALGNAEALLAIRAFGMKL